MIKIKLVFSVLFIATGFVIGCSKGSGSTGNGSGNQTPVNCDAIHATFSGDIAPLIQTQCAIGSGCHGAGSSNGPGQLTSFNEIKGASSNIKSAVESGRMPLGGSLSQAQINLVRCWVDSGSPAN
jgi:hypothetical protein